MCWVRNLSSVFYLALSGLHLELSILEGAREVLRIGNDQWFQQVTHTCCFRIDSDISVSRPSRSQSPKLDNCDQPDLIASSVNPCSPILTIISSYRMHGDAASLKRVLVESFSDIEHSNGIKAFRDYCHV